MDTNKVITAKKWLDENEWPNLPPNFKSGPFEPEMVDVRHLLTHTLLFKSSGVILSFPLTKL